MQTSNRILIGLLSTIALAGCASDPHELSLEDYVAAEDQPLLHGGGAQPTAGMFDGQEVVTLPVTQRCDFGPNVQGFIPVVEVQGVTDTAYTQTYRDPNDLTSVIGGSPCTRVGRSGAQCGSGEPSVIDLAFAGLDARVTLTFDPSRDPVLWLSRDLYYEYQPGAHYTCEGADCAAAASNVFGLSGGFPCAEADVVQRFHRRP